MDHIRLAAHWIADHWVTLLTLWPLVTAILTTLWRALPEAWRARFAERYPRLDALARVLRKAGLDLLPVLSDSVRVLTGRRLRLPPTTPEPPAPEITEGSER